MGILRVIIWSALCIGLGVFLGSHDFKGRTAVEHAQKALEGKRPKLDEVKDDVVDAIDSAKKKLAVKDDAPTEKHTEQDREAVNKLIARRKP